jgi:hypothetical protein
MILSPVSKERPILASILALTVICNREDSTKLTTISLKTQLALIKTVIDRIVSIDRTAGDCFGKCPIFLLLLGETLNQCPQLVKGLGIMR